MALQDFTTWTKVEADALITITAHDIACSDTAASNSDRVYKDYAAGHFSGNFTHQFEFTLHTINAGAHFRIWALSNQSGGQFFFGNDTIALSIISYGTGFKIVLEDVGGQYSGYCAATLVLQTRYYITIIREGAVYTAYVRTGSHTGTQITTATITPASAISAEYLYAFADNLNDE